jgi:hypothetical protein
MKTRAPNTSSAATIPLPRAKILARRIEGLGFTTDVEKVA